MESMAVLDALVAKYGTITKLFAVIFALYKFIKQYEETVTVTKKNTLRLDALEKNIISIEKTLINVVDDNKLERELRILVEALGKLDNKMDGYINKDVYNELVERVRSVENAIFNTLSAKNTITDSKRSDLSRDIRQLTNMVEHINSERCDTK